MEETFDIKIVHRYKVNKYGYEVIAVGAICFFVLIIFSTPYRIMGMGIDMIPIELNFATLLSIIIILIGLILNVIRKKESASMTIDAKGITIKNNRTFKNFYFEKIKKFKGTGLGIKTIHFKIITEEGDEIEIKTDKDIYEGLIAYFPNKEEI